MMVSQWLKVNTSRALSRLPLIGLSAVAILSVTIRSEAHVMDAHHVGSTHALHHFNAASGAQHFDALHHFDVAHHSDVNGMSAADSSVLNIKDASHVARVFDVAHVRSDAAADATVPNGVDASFVRIYAGINIYGAGKDWHALAPYYGYYLSDKPVTGGAVCFEGGAYGTSAAYGFVGVVVYYKDYGDYWEVGTRYAYPTEGASYYDYTYVKEQAFRVLKNDRRVHYIYRSGMNVRPSGYYTRPEYAGYNVVGKQYELSAQTKDVVVYPKDGHAKAYVGPNQVVRVLAKAEPGETIWVFVETPYRAGTVYAKTYYDGKEQLRKFDASSPEASRMYYAKNYGDTVLDLGYADYSEIAGDSREVTITVKKGSDPVRLQLLQAVRLQLAGK